MKAAFRHRRVLGLALCAAALLLLAGCAAKTARRAQAPLTGMSEGAQADYYYLVYLERLGQMQRLIRTQQASPAARGELELLQKSAAQALDLSIQARPAASLYVEKANLYWNPQQIRMARPILEEGLKRFPDDRGLNLNLANAWVLEGRPAEAAQIFERYVARYPDDYEAREDYAGILVETKDFTRALETLKPIPAKKMTSQTYYRRGQAEAGAGRRSQAVRSLREAVKTDPEFFEAWALMAFQHEMLKEYAAAREIYAKLLGMDESRDEVRVRLIDMLLKLKQPDKALAVAKDGPRQRTFLLDAIEAFLRGGYPRQADAALEALAKDSSVGAEYFFYKAMIAQDGDNDTAKALRYLSRVAEDDPHFMQALQFRAQLLAALKRPDEALAAAEEGIRRFPQQSRFYVLKAGILAERQDMSGARLTMEQGLAAAPDDSDLLYRYGLIVREGGDEAGALAVMEKVVAKNPNHADAMNYVGYSLADQGRDLERALALVQGALSLEPENGYIIDSLAWVYFRMNRLDEAWTQIRRAVAATPEDPEIWLHYGDIARAVGNGAEAKVGYRNALRHKHKDPAAVKARLESL